MTKQKAFLTFFFWFFLSSSYAQNTGDFQSRISSGNWSNFSTWNIYNGTGWVAAMPGQLPNSTSTVFIQVGHVVTVDNLAAECNDLNISAGGSTGRLSFAATGLLNVKGSITFHNTTSNYLSPWAAGGKLILSGTGNQGLIGLTAATVFVDIEINKPSGTVTTSSNVRFGNFTVTSGDFVVGPGFDIQGASASSIIQINAGTWTQTAGATRINVAGNASLPIGQLIINGGRMTLATTSTGGGFNFSTIQVINNGILQLNNFNGAFSVATSISVDAGSTLNVALGTNFSLPASISFEGIVNYNHTGPQVIPPAAYRYLKLSGSGLKSLASGITSIPQNGTMEMNGTIASPTFDASGASFNVSTDNTTLIYSATTAQMASSNEWNPAFSNVVINNPAGVSMAGLTRSITNTLTLTTGTFNIGAAGALQLNGASLVRTSGFLTGTNSSDLTVTGSTGGMITIPHAGNLSLRNVLISGNRTLRLNGINHLNLSGLLEVGSTAVFDNGGESQVLQNTGGNIIINGKFITRDAEGFTGTNAAIPGIIPVLNAGCTIEYGAIGNQILNARTDYKNITLSGGGSKFLSSGCFPAGTVRITDNAVLETLNFTFGDVGTNLTMDGGRFRIAGTGTKPDMQGSYNISGGVIEFIGGTPATSQTIRSSASIFYSNIEINSLYVSNSNANINLHAGGSFTLKSGSIFTINDESITGQTGAQTVTIESGARFVCGDADGFSGGTGSTATSIRSDVENIVIQTGSTIEYARTAPQVFSSRADYSHVTITGGGEKILNGPAVMGGILQLNNGLVTTTSANLLTLSATATCPAGGNPQSFVNGPMRKIGNSAFLFPIGKKEVSGAFGGGFRFVGISAPSQLTDAFTAEFIVGSGTALGPISSAAFSAGLTRVSRCEYWLLDRTSGTSSVNVTLSWNIRSNCNVSYVSSLPDLAIAHFNQISNEWDQFGANSWTGNVSSGTITWNNVSSFSPFALASTDFLENLLPLDFLNFQVKPRLTDILTTWEVSNNDELSYFELEKSRNSHFFEFLSRTSVKSGDGKMQYSQPDKTPYLGWNYYRLRTIYKQGKVVLSPIIKVWFGAEQQIRISPNPASDKIFINFSEPSSISQIEIVNISGQVLKRITAIQFNNQITISHLQAGMYYVRIMGNNGLTTTSFVKQ